VGIICDDEEVVERLYQLGEIVVDGGSECPAATHSAFCASVCAREKSCHCPRPRGSTRAPSRSLTISSKVGCRIACRICIDPACIRHCMQGKQMKPLSSSSSSSSSSHYPADKHILMHEPRVPTPKRPPIAACRRRSKSFLPLLILAGIIYCFCSIKED